MFTPEEWDRLLAQVGYGNIKAPLWFLGMEEGLDERRVSIAENLRWRLDHFTQPFDTMTHHLQASWIAKDANNEPILPKTQTWRTMAKIARYLAEAPDWQDHGKAKDYVVTHLGEEYGQTLLLELLPLPMSHHSGWLDIFDEHFRGGISAFRKQMLPKRIKLLKDLLTDQKPKRVICYGKANWQSYKEIFPEVVWTCHMHGDKTWAKCGKLGDTTVVLTPFFGNGAMSNHALGELCALLRRSSGPE